MESSQLAVPGFIDPWSGRLPRGLCGTQPSFGKVVQRLPKLYVYWRFALHFAAKLRTLFLVLKQ